MVKKNHRNYLASSLIPPVLARRLKDIGNAADAAGIRLYLVGGFVRDLLLRRLVWDIDVVGERDPLPIVSTLDGMVTRHTRFITYSVCFNDATHIDFSTARIEWYAAPAALPSVSPGSLQDDLRRRDFTCNAIALGLNKDTFGALYDPFEGKADLAGKKLRVFHEHSFRDDPTRIFRAARFMGRYGFTLEPRTESYMADAIKNKIPWKLSRQRITNEFKKIISEKNPEKILTVLSRWGMSAVIHPAIKKCSWKPLSLHPRPIEFSLAWFFQQLKPDAAGALLDNLKFDRWTIDRVVSLLSAIHALKKPGTIRASLIEDFCNEDIYNIKFLTQVSSISRSVLKNLERLRLHRKALLNGADLHRLGFLPGKQYGQILKVVRKKVWDGMINDRQEAIAFVVAHFNNRTK